MEEHTENREKEGAEGREGVVPVWASHWAVGRGSAVGMEGSNPRRASPEVRERKAGRQRRLLQVTPLDNESSPGTTCPGSFHACGYRQALRPTKLDPASGLWLAVCPGPSLL